MIGFYLIMTNGLTLNELKWPQMTFNDPDLVKKLLGDVLLPNSRIGKFHQIEPKYSFTRYFESSILHVINWKSFVKNVNSSSIHLVSRYSKSTNRSIVWNMQSQPIIMDIISQFTR